MHIDPDMATAVLSFATTTVPAWCRQGSSTSERLALFAQAEAMFGPPGGDAAVAARLPRLRWEIDAYLGRLAAAKLCLSCVCKNASGAITSVPMR
jgi:hypothetical protein